MIQNKYIIRFSFIGFFLSIIAIIVLYHYFIIGKIILKQTTNYNLYLAESYIEKVIDKNQQLFTQLFEARYKELSSSKNFKEVIRLTSSFLKTVDSDIRLYNYLGKRLLIDNANVATIDVSNNVKFYNKLLYYLDQVFLSQYYSLQPLFDALQGKVSNVLALCRGEVIIDVNNNINGQKSSYISSYIPIIKFLSKDSEESKIIGVIEVITDITNSCNSLTYLEKQILIAFLVVFLIFFITIMRNTHDAQKIINKQFKTNKELEKAKTRAETESSEKTDFLANISHELRTPLNAIIGFSEIMIAGTYGKIGNYQYQDYVSDINSSGKHLLSMINDILDFSKASADKLQVDKVELDLNKLASSSMRFVKPRADELNILLIEKMPSSHIIIIADPKRLKQALLNLLSNSVKFTLPGGTVTLTLKQDDTKKLVHIIVTDTGIGMSDQEIPKALSSFGQVDNKLSKRYEGTGLGLPLTQKLIELMDGKFDLQSKPSKGTTVAITFEYSESIDL